MKEDEDSMERALRREVDELRSEYEAVMRALSDFAGKVKQRPGVLARLVSKELQRAQDKVEASEEIIRDREREIDTLQTSLSEARAAKAYYEEMVCLPDAPRFIPQGAEACRDVELEKVGKIIEDRDRARQEVAWALREYDGDHDAVEAEIVKSGRGVPDICYAMAKMRGALKTANASTRRRGEQRDAANTLLRDLEQHAPILPPAFMDAVRAHLAASPSPAAEGDGAGREPLTEWRPHDGQHHAGDEKGLSAYTRRKFGSIGDTDARRAQGGDDA